MLCLCSHLTCFVSELVSPRSRVLSCVFLKVGVLRIDFEIWVRSVCLVRGVASLTMCSWGKTTLTSVASSCRRCAPFHLQYLGPFCSVVLFRNSIACQSPEFVSPIVFRLALDVLILGQKENMLMDERMLFILGQMITIRAF